MKPEMGKHKKNKSDRRDRYDNPLDASRNALSLKLILKVGNQGTPEHTTDWSYPNSTTNLGDDVIQQSLMNDYFSIHRSHHKKSKKKKKKKDKSKDRERKHRHHHKDKKRKRIESGQEEDDGSEHSNAINSHSIANVGSPSGRELRQCVLRQRQERTPLQRALEHLLKKLEQRDPQQFFAWPVTDNIAPGYSAIITHPMDFCTMRQKVDDNQYNNLQEFVADFKLMCTNAMQYNQSDTIYYKASKKLLHAGLKLIQPDKIGWLITLTPDITSRDLGFEITPELRQEQKAAASFTEVDAHDDMEMSTSNDYIKKRLPVTKFEAIPDDLLPEQILARAQNAAREVKAKLNAKQNNPNIGFLRQRKDGSTYLNILVGGDGVIPGTKKRPVLLGSLTGKLNDGSSQLQGFREDRRNLAKPVKPLYYGAFGSYAPSYDSAFANLTKDESDLVFQTYGSDTSVQYAESILDFAKDCDYTLQMVDSLLDLLTGGDHSKTKKILEEKKMLREEEDAIKTVLETKPCTSTVPVDIDDLRSLSNQGINVDFLDEMEDDIRMFEDWQQLQQRLDVNSQLLESLQRKQHSRLSMPLPQHLNNIPPPSEEEVALAESVTDNLTDMAKRINPGDIAPIQGIHKALGVNLPTDMEVGGTDVPDLESELRQFLESEPSLAQSPLRDDKTIEEILME